jgi:hypothetical protein
VIDVPNRSNVHMWFGTVKFFLRHDFLFSCI